MPRKTISKQKVVSKWEWEHFTELDDLSVGDIDMIRRTLLFIKAGPIDNPLQYFWTMVLLPYYDSVYFSHLNQEAAYVLYRLSETMAPEVRALINVYPNGDVGWFTLEDWRVDFISTLARGEDDIPLISGTPPELPWM